MRIFILDDTRSIRQACRDAHIEVPEISRSRALRSAEITNLCHDYFMARNIEDAMEMVRYNPTFDMWVLDNDLGVNRDREKEEGYDFLRDMMQRFPGVVPERVVSCSANPIRRGAIEDLFRSWHDAGRPDTKIIGQED